MRELDYKATSQSVQLSLSSPSTPQDPYTQGDWKRQANGQWQRQVITELNEHGPVYRPEQANPEHAAELDRQSRAVMAENIARSHAGLAAGYETAYRQHGWQAHGPVPAAVANARYSKPGEGCTGGPMNGWRRSMRPLSRRP